MSITLVGGAALARPVAARARSCLIGCGTLADSPTVRTTAALMAAGSSADCSHSTKAVVNQIDPLSIAAETIQLGDHRGPTRQRAVSRHRVAGGGHPRTLEHAEGDQ